MHAEDEAEGRHIFGDHSMAEDVVAFGFQPSKHIWTILDLAEGKSRHDSEVKLEMFAHGVRLKVVNVAFDLRILRDFTSLGDVGYRFVVGDNACILVTDLKVGNELCEDRREIDGIIIGKW